MMEHSGKNLLLREYDNTMVFKIYQVHPVVVIHFTNNNKKTSEVSYGGRPKEVTYHSLYPNMSY